LTQSQPKKPVTIKMAGELQEAYERIAKRRAVSRNTLMIEALEAYLAILESGRAIVPDHRDARAVQPVTATALERESV
jgi:hypothetical protein